MKRNLLDELNEGFNALTSAHGLRKTPLKTPALVEKERGYQFLHFPYNGATLLA